MFACMYVCKLHDNIPPTVGSLKFPVCARICRSLAVDFLQNDSSNGHTRTQVGNHHVCMYPFIHYDSYLQRKRNCCAKFKFHLILFHSLNTNALEKGMA